MDKDAVVVDDPVVEEEPSVEIEAESPSEIPQQAEDDVEREARESGWVPQKDWKGDPKRWRDAATFIDSRNHILPLVQKENRSLRVQLEQANERLARLEASEAERNAAREQLSVETLKIERRQAYEEQNWDKVTELDDKLIKAAVKEGTKSQAQPQIDPKVNQIWEEFRAENEWVKAPEAQQVLMEKMVVMRQAGSTLAGRELLEKAKDRVRREYPEFFPTSRRPMAENAGVSGATRSRTLSWNDLKPEVRDAWERHMLPEKGITKQGLLKQAAENPSMYFRT